MDEQTQRVAIVTGGSRGLGRGVVEAFTTAGLRTIALARDAGHLAELAAAIPGVGTVVGDAADETLAARLVRDEHPDVVVLCAGAEPHLAPLHEQTWESFSKCWHVDTRSAFAWLRAALTQPMKPGSHVIVVSSGAAVAGSPVSGGYAAAKRGQWFIADYAAAESTRLGLGLRVHCVLPNLNPNTDLGRHAVAAYSARTGLAPEEYLKRFGPPLTPAIMGEAITALVNDPASYPHLAYRVTGGGLVSVTT